MEINMERKEKNRNVPGEAKILQGLSEQMAEGQKSIKQKGSSKMKICEKKYMYHNFPDLQPSSQLFLPETLVRRHHQKLAQSQQ